MASNMNFLKIAVIILVNAVIINAATTGKVLIPCEDDNDCTGFENATCINAFCTCNGTTTCLRKFTVGVSRIGENCTETDECLVKNSECRNNTCSCENGFVKTTNGRKCLKISDGVDSSCEDDVQCYTKTNHTICRNNKCACNGTHQVNGACFKNAKLGESCKVNPECSLNKFSSCVNSTCQCNVNYTSGLNNTVCLPVSLSANSSCVEKAQCTVSMGDNAHCVDGLCNCKELYYYKDKINKCVEDKFYGERCATHSDCHNPFPEKESRLECIIGECKCRSGFIEKHGICIDPSSSSQVLASLFLFVPTLIIVNLL
ncbi:unnamed protein product [Phyllotreta striolata]|uniref:EB domain-containing protein n=1 Tax=Phyllotreta striolata TaxID=444603 RepID=A0A9N9XR11_PHYSR|nr:unnamed protein product [Phyllotreta striolata]